MPAKRGSKRASKKRSYKSKKRSVKKRSYKPRKSLKRSYKSRKSLKRSYKPKRSLKRSAKKSVKWGSGTPAVAKQIINKLMSISKLDSDFKSLARIANLIKSGKVSAAYSLARDQDTFVREMIPNNAWRYMETH